MKKVGITVLIVVIVLVIGFGGISFFSGYRTGITQSEWMAMRNETFSIDEEGDYADEKADLDFILETLFDAMGENYLYDIAGSKEPEADDMVNGLIAKGIIEKKPGRYISTDQAKDILDEAYKYTEDIDNFPEFCQGSLTDKVVDTSGWSYSDFTENMDSVNVTGATSEPKEGEIIIVPDAQGYPCAKKITEVEKSKSGYQLGLDAPDSVDDVISDMDFSGTADFHALTGKSKGSSRLVKPVYRDRFFDNVSVVNASNKDFIYDVAQEFWIPGFSPLIPETEPVDLKITFSLSVDQKGKWTGKADAYVDEEPVNGVEYKKGGGVQFIENMFGSDGGGKDENEIEKSGKVSSKLSGTLKLKDLVLGASNQRKKDGDEGIIVNCTATPTIEISNKGSVSGEIKFRSLDVMIPATAGAVQFSITPKVYIDASGTATCKMEIEETHIKALVKENKDAPWNKIDSGEFTLEDVQPLVKCLYDKEERAKYEKYVTLLKGTRIGTVKGEPEFSKKVEINGGEKALIGLKVLGVNGVDLYYSVGFTAEPKKLEKVKGWDDYKECVDLTFRCPVASVGVEVIDGLFTKDILLYDGKEKSLVYKVWHLEYDENNKMHVAKKGCTHREKTDEEIAEEARKKDPSYQARQAYIKWIKKKCPDSYDRFWLGNIDGDDVPELIAMHGGTGDAGNGEYHEYYYIICSYYDGKVHQSEELYEWDEIRIDNYLKIIKEDGIISDDWYGTGNSYGLYIYSLQQGEVQESQSLSCDPLFDDFEINGKKCSGQEFDSLYNDLYASYVENDKAVYMKDLEYVDKSKVIKQLEK